MNVLDYNKRLTDYRDRFNEDAQKMRYSHKRSLQNEKDTHDARTEKQFNTYKKDLGNIREDTTKLIDRSRDNNAYELEKKRDLYNQNLKEERDRFAEFSKDQVHDFRKKNGNLREAFNKNQEQTKKFHNSSLENTKKNFEGRLREINSNHQEQLAILNDGAKIRADKKIQDFEKQNMIDDYEQKLTDQRIDLRNENNDLRTRTTKDIDNLEKTYTETALQRRENQSQNALNQHLNSELKFKEHHELTQDKIEQNDKVHGDNERLLIDKYEKKITDVRDEFGKKLEFEKTKDDRFEEGSFEEFTAAKQKDLTEAKLSHKIDELGKINYSLKEKMSEREVRLSKKAQEDIKRNAAQEKQKRIELEREFSKTTIDQAARHAKKTNKIVDSLESKIKEQERVATGQIRNTEDRKKEQLQKLKENFNTSLADINYKSTEQLESVQDQANMDKKSFMNRVIAEKTSDKMESARDHKRRMMSMQSDYEKKISNLEIENQKVRNQMNYSIQTLTQKHNDTMEEKQAYFDEFREGELRRFESRSIEKDNEYKNKIQGVHGQYQKRMEDQRLANLNEMRNKSNDYELKMSNMSKKHKKMIVDLVRDHQRVMQEKTNQLDIEKGQLITKYENEISRLKNLHQLEKDRVDKYQRLASQPA